MNRIYNAVMGLVVGDAVGVPFEFKRRDTFICSDMVGNGTHSQPAGTWSDDSSMVLATLDSLVCLRSVSPNDIMDRFAGWLYEGLYTPYGKVFDVGNLTSTAITKFVTGTPIDKCGGTSVRDNGNGALMRILPLAFIDYESFDKQAECVDIVSGLTHEHAISKTACQIYICIAQELLKAEKDKESSIRKGIQRAENEYKSAWEVFKRLPDIESVSRDEIRSTGYVVDTLEAALWCVLRTESYGDCILEAVNLGDDTDTVAAVAGGLAGIIYGVGGKYGIPKSWIAKTARSEAIGDLCKNVEEVHIIY